MQNELAILEFIHCLVETLDRYADILGARCSNLLHIMTTINTLTTSP